MTERHDRTGASGAQEGLTPVPPAKHQRKEAREDGTWLDAGGVMIDGLGEGLLGLAFIGAAVGALLWRRAKRAGPTT